MLVRQPVITNQRVGDRRMSASEQMDAKFEKYNTTFHTTRAFVRKMSSTSLNLLQVEDVESVVTWPSVMVGHRPLVRKSIAF